jgi:hypothetical protein
MISRLIHILFIFVSIAWCVIPVSTMAEQIREEGVDRPGSDYRNFDLEKPLPGSFGGPEDTCRDQCESDGNCKAWTFVKAGIQGPKPRCWLKNAIPEPHANNCCVSGVPIRTFETNIDRPGKDYNNIDLAASDPNLCKTVCERDGRNCRAWTFVKPGVQGTKARCWLKFDVPPAFTNNCCTSGAHFIQPN